MFWNNFVRLCNQKNVSPSQVAETVGLSRAAASGWKTGKTPSYPNLYKLAGYFGCSVDDLLEERELDTENDYTQLLFERSEMRLLFDAAKNASPDVVRTAAKIIEALKDE